MALKITKVGNLAGLVLAKEALSKLQVEQGDTVFLTEAPDGFRITPYRPAFERQTAVTRRLMKNHRNALRGAGALTRWRCW